MKRKWKVAVAIGLLVTTGIAVYAGIKYSRRGVVTVQTGRVARQNLTSQVTASGEIKPRLYINIGANAMGQITELLVKEGDRVTKGQLLARLESVQPEADVNASRAALSASEAESSASEAGVLAAEENIRTAQASIDRAKAELERVSLDYKRAEQLYNDKLIARQEYDTRKAAFEAQEAAVREAQARLVQARAQKQQSAAQMSAVQRKVSQVEAQLTRVSDVLRKHNSYAPLDGVVTNLPVRVGETVVPGIQNSAASTIMTIADMSLITAEVKVDETDIVNVKLNQIVEVTIDAIPNRTFRGHVIEIGNTAILRSTGMAASQSMISSQEAKDFKVVAALDNPPEEIRPGLSCTAKITTATRDNILTIPIQALTVRSKSDLEAKRDEDAVSAATAQPKDPKDEIQGVFVIKDDRVEFRKVETGITGSVETEVLNGLKDGEIVVTGSYQAIRTLKNEAEG